MKDILIGDARSTEITAAHRKIVRAAIKHAKTQTAAARLLGFDRTTIADVLTKPTCSPKTIEKIKKYEKEYMAA